MKASTKKHSLEIDGFLLNKELISVIKILIGSRGLGKVELLSIISKLKMFTTCHDREVLEQLISKEVFHYREVHHDCKSVIDYVWKLTRCINERRYFFGESRRI